MRRFSFVHILSGWLACGSAWAQPVDYVIDQAHDLPDVIEGIHSLRGYPSITQEFTPTFGALDIIEVYTRDWGNPRTNGLGATLQVSLRENSTNGALVAISAPLALPDDWLGPSQFLFPQLAWLTPGKRYAIELRLLQGDNWGVDSYGTFGPPYDGGRYFVGTNLIASADMWFRTGVRVPGARLVLERERVLRWEGIPPLLYSVWTSSNLTNWTHAGFAQSATPNYSFTNSTGDAAMLFYKVSFP